MFLVKRHMNIKKPTDHSPFSLKGVVQVLQEKSKIMIAALPLLYGAYRWWDYLMQPNPPGITQIAWDIMQGSEYAEFRESQTVINTWYYAGKPNLNEDERRQLTATLTNLDTLLEMYRNWRLSSQQLLWVIAAPLAVISTPGTFLSLESLTHDGKPWEFTMKSLVSSGFFPDVTSKKPFAMSDFVVEPIPWGGWYIFSFTRPDGSYVARIWIRLAPGRYASAQ